MALATASRKHEKTVITSAANSSCAANASDCCPPTATTIAPRAPEHLDAERAAEALASLAKALGHPVRVRILRLLSARAGCVCGSIVDELPLAQSTVSEHLRILKAAGLVRGTLDGPRTCYCIDADGLAQLKALTSAL